MSITRYKTSNPAFTPLIWKGYSYSSNRMTLRGVILKTFFCLVILSASTCYVWDLVHQGVDAKWYIYLGLLAAIILSILTSYIHKWAVITTPLYALAKGVFLGGISAYAELKFEGIPMRSVGVTIIVFFVMLVLYRFRIVMLTRKFRSVIIGAIISITAIYLISWILNLFGISASIIYGTSNFSILFNIIAACIASLVLLIDFDFIEGKINHVPKYMEWVATWGLLVTLIWLYIEILRLLKKLIIRF
jgi:uncharacterized YccA/Bax inhibitor family protein